MAKASSSKSGTRHPLIIYQFMAQRYGPPGFLLILMGLLAQAPTFVTQLRFASSILTYQQLSILGIAAVIGGLVIFLGSILGARQSYVQCLPDYFVIHTPFNRVFCAYQRINSIQPVLVGRVFPLEDLKKERERELIKKLVGETAIEINLSSYPLPEKQLRKRFSRLLFSPKNNGFVLIVPKPSQLSIELNTFNQRALDKRDEAQQRYMDPIERLKYQNNKTF